MHENNQPYKYHSIMVIEDTQTDRYIIEHYLKKCFITSNIIAKWSAIEALEYLAQHANSKENLPSLIFLDIRLPGMDGFEFLDEFEKLPPFVHEHCPVVMLSSSIDPGDQERAQNNRFVKKFINKPLNKEKLQDL